MLSTVVSVLLLICIVLCIFYEYERWNRRTYGLNGQLLEQLRPGVREFMDNNKQAYVSPPEGFCQEEECVICLEELNASITEHIIVLPCGNAPVAPRLDALRSRHIFHFNCLNMWINMRDVCPLCQCVVGQTNQNN